MSQTAEQDPKSDAVALDPEVLVAARAASDKKAIDIVVLDLRAVASFTDYFVICNGANSRQVQAIAEGVEDALRQDGKRPLHTEGYSAADWILLDYGDFIVHVFGAQTRKFYDLERLWRDATRAALPDDLAAQNQ